MRFPIIRAATLVVVSASSAIAQTMDDGLSMPRKAASAGVLYSHESWTEYWEGTLKRSNGNIGNVAPGVGFYFVSLPGAGTYTISQSDNGTTPAFGVQSVQVTFTNCDVDQSVTPTISNGGATITVAGPRVVRLVFDPNTVVGTLNPAPQPTIVYTYTTSGVANSTDTINLTRSS